MAIDDLVVANPTVRSGGDAVVAGPELESNPDEFFLPPSRSLSRQSSISSFAVFSIGALEKDPFLLETPVEANQEFLKGPPAAVAPQVSLSASVLPKAHQAPPPPFDQAIGPQVDLEGKGMAAAVKKAPSSMGAWQDVRAEQVRQDLETIRPILQDRWRLDAVLQAYNEEKSLAGLTITITQSEATGALHRQSTDDSLPSIGTWATHQASTDGEDERKPPARPSEAVPPSEESSPRSVADARVFAPATARDVKNPEILRQQLELVFEDSVTPKKARSKRKARSHSQIGQDDEEEDASFDPRPTKKAKKKKKTPQSHRSEPKQGGIALTVTDVKAATLRPHILCRRGGGGNKHERNAEFRRYCATRAVEYRALPKQEQKGFALGILEYLQNEWSACFLAKDDAWSGENERWYEIVDQEAREKVSQTLREAYLKLAREGSL